MHVLLIKVSRLEVFLRVQLYQICTLPFLHGGHLENCPNCGSEQWLNYHENNSCISLNDSNNIDLSEIEKRAFYGGKGKNAFQCGGHLECHHLKT